jgi:TolB-like protein
MPLGKAGSEGASLTLTLETPLHILKAGSLVAGKYQIVEEIGRGGMGVVYKAEDIKLKRCVAVKFLPPHLMDSPELKQRFLIEAQAAAALSHPNICVIHEVGESEERPYIAMEYVEGETLRDKIKKGPLKVEEALDLAIQIAAGLGESHRKGIIHRDIKSANIMVTEKGQAKVMDFGLAKLRGGSSLTRSQTTLGTVAYMSPEQARGNELDGRTDIWSLGVILYEMLAGKLPFRGDHDQTVIYSILHQEPESLMKARPGTAPELEHIVGQALAKKQADRYQTMEEFREDLAAVAEGFRPLKAKRRVRRKIFGLNVTYLLRAVMAVIFILFGLNIGGFRDRIFGRKGSAEPAIRLAVLPFRNLTGDPAQEYLSDGITEEMIAQLGRLNPQRLGLIGRTTVMRYKKEETPIDQIGRELGVNYILEGSMQREAKRVRVTAALIHVSDQTQIWADTYEQELSGILTVQSQVAWSVAKALAVKLLPAEEARLASVRTINPEAYEAYLKGSALWQTMKSSDFDAAQRFFDLALEKDSSYAPAYEGLTWVWMARQQMGFAPLSEAGPKAKAMALQALALDDNSAGAHEALATVMTWAEWDWAGAETEWPACPRAQPQRR